MHPKKQKERNSSTFLSSKWDYHLGKSEDLLITVGKWPLVTSRLLGLFPFNFSRPETPDGFLGLEKARLFKVNFFPFLRVSWIFIGCVSLMYCGTLGYYSLSKYGDYGKKYKNKVLNLFSNEGEKFMHTYNGILLVTLALSTRLLIEFFSDAMLSFWQSFLHLFAAFQRLGYLTSESRCFKKMHLHIKILTVVCGIIAAFQTGIMISLYSMFKRARPSQHNSFLTAPVVDTFWFICILFVHANVLVLALLGFILFVLAACFRATSVELSKMMLSAVNVERKDVGDGEAITTGPLHETEEALFFGNDKVYEDNPISNAQSKILMLMELYDEATETILHFNKVFAGPIILEVMSCISSSIGFVYSFNKLIYEVELDSYDNMDEILTRLPTYLLLVLRLLILIWICGGVSSEADAAMKVLQKTPATLVETSPALQLKIHMLVTREAANPTTISPGNFFPVNKTFLASILSLLGTYYIVLSGFREEGELWNMIRNKTMLHRPHAIIN